LVADELFVVLVRLAAVVFVGERFVVLARFAGARLAGGASIAAG
jgi:hypothetical protein